MTEQLILEGLERRCRKCGAVRTPGKRCQPCRTALAKARHLADPGKQKARSRAWYVANRERAKAHSRKWREANLERSKAIVAAWEAANPDKVYARHHASYIANREKVLARSRARRKANPEKGRMYSRKWAAGNPEKVRANSRVAYLRSYGLSAADYDAMLSAQQGVCRICRTIKPGAKRGWHVDHDHACCQGSRSCGRCVRGLLCHGCNLMLGHAGDSVETLRRAIEYLETPRLRLVGKP